MAARQITILGVGLLGGSLGMALRKLPRPWHVVGYGHRRETLETAKRLGAIDRGESDPVKSVAASAMVVLCTPVGAFEDLLKQISPALKAGCVVTDVGSTKQSIVRLGEQLLPRGVHFVGSHPMAGSEKRGVEFARADLFQHSLCILTPTQRTSVPALQEVESLWKSVGMRMAFVSPKLHDRRLAEISHLPHILAAALVAMQEQAALKLIGKGFLDTTRIAAGDGGLWRDILIDNAENVRQGIAHLREQLKAVEGMLDPSKADELRRWLDAAASRRQALASSKKN